MLKKIYTIFILLIVSSYVFGQVTTSRITGQILDQTNSEPLIGANVIAVHIPSGTQYGSITNENGTFNVPNMRVGGPYTLEVSYIGYTTQEITNITLQLGQKLDLDFKLIEDGVTFDEIVVTAKVDPLLNNERTGAETTIGRETLEKLPTISRSTSDFTRLNPMSSEGGSFGGRNDQFNNYSVDGAIFNNPFGLDAATPGGQTDANPISLDAIDQVNVAVAPYDVTLSGFTGAAINAVTKSGTNEVKGTAYGYYRNKNMNGTKVDGVDVTKGDLKSSLVGVSIGAPIVKNKVFVFANFESQQRSDLGSYFLANRGTGAANESRVLATDLDAVSKGFKDKYGYETGAYENFEFNANNYKGLVKLDFNLNKSHKLTASYNFLNAFKDNPAHPSAIGRRGPDFQTLQFQNSGYRINNKINSAIVELKSFFSNKYANKLQVGYTSFRDEREPFSTPFPVVNLSKDGIRYIVAGHEPFSIHNVLDQDVFQITDNFNIYLGNHTITIGGSLEKFNFNNSFNLGAYGGLVFAPDLDINVFQDSLAAGYYDGAVDAATAKFKSDTWALAETNIGQTSFYAQDEFAANDKLTLTYGLRIDVPLYFDTKEKIEENITRNPGGYQPDITYYNAAGEPIKYDHTQLPKSTPLINPRFGFNYDVNGDKSLQLRGGSGLFSGRFPFVWVGNQVANPNFYFYCVTDPNFRYPQVWRTNLGIDKKIGAGWVASADFIYTKDLQSQMVQNHALKLPSGKLEGIDNRPIYLNSDRSVNDFGGITNAYVFTNVTAGYSLNTSFQLQRTWNNTYAMIGYNYLDSKDAASIDAEISSDAFDRNPANIQHTNNAEIAPSLYGNKHRIIGAASKTLSYGANKEWNTNFALFFEYVSGKRYSYTYSGDINNDGSGLNDLIYIPTDAQIDGMSFNGDAAAQRAALKKYIAQDDYLSDRRGDYAEKYGALTPWYNHWDFKASQTYNLENGDQIEFSLDILNIGNMISNKWGVRQYATQTGLAQVIGVAVADGVPTYSFDANQTKTFQTDFSLSSRWQMQAGLRYRF